MECGGAKVVYISEARGAGREGRGKEEEGGGSGR